MNSQIPKKDRLVLIGPVNDLLGADFLPKEQHEFKYLMINEKGLEYPQMLIMDEYNPYTYHAQALKSYMKERQLQEITVNGGGKIRFNPQYHECRVSGKSYAFGEASGFEVLDFVKSIWPEMSVLCGASKDRLGIFTSGKVYNLDQVQYYIDHP
jgi:hypothetical protein